MTNDTINDAVTIPGKGGGAAPAGSGTPIDMSVGDGLTMRPKDERAGRGAFAPGDVIAGRYVVEKILGEGGMGIVYQCLDRVGGVGVAVKCLPPEVSRNADEMEDIRANYRLVSDLHHPNIAGARTLEVDGATGDYYLVMDLARGMSLKRWMKRNPQAAMEAKLDVLRQVAAALDYAHARKVIHRDVKPENVMVDDEGGVKVLDFGLAAQIRSSQSRTSAAVTSRGGTPGYKSPEQWLGRAQREPADVYSFGVMAYWMFAGELPFDGDDPVVLGHAVLTAPVEPIAGLPAHMNTALAKALSKKPEERFASCGAVVDALEGANLSTQRREGAEAQGGRAGAPRPPQDDGGARRPAEPAGRRVPRDRVDAAEEAKRARAETKIRMLRLKQISDDDGFARRKSELNDAFQKADIFFESGLWADAASRFAECSRQVENLDKLDSERKTAVEMRKKAAAAQRGAQDAQAGKYAAAEWDNAARLLSEGEAAYGRMDFAAAIVAFGDSAVGFSKSEHKAIEEREAREEAERKAREEAERKAREVAKRKAREEAERKAREEAEHKAREEAKRKAWEEAVRKACKEAERKVREATERKAREEAVKRKVHEESERKGVAGKVLALASLIGLVVGGGLWLATIGNNVKEISPTQSERGVRRKVQLWEGGPYWACKNIGAEEPWESGYYFWWGDTVGYKCVGDTWVASDGSVQDFPFSAANAPTCGKSYVALEREGWITEAGVLAPEHDAAHVKWGGDWRMPTKQELEDLNSKCVWKWAKMNGVYGYEVRGKGSYASASIFLPCFGYGIGASLLLAGSSGYYWSSVPHSSSSYSSRAWSLYFTSGVHNTISDYYRLLGQSVRPVQGFTR